MEIGKKTGETLGRKRVQPKNETGENVPTNRKRIARGRKGARNQVTDAALSYFHWNGTLHVGPVYEWAQERTEAEIRAFWDEHRVEILSAYIEKNQIQKGEPGKRPQAFWNELSQAGKRRKKTGTEKFQGPMTKDGLPEPETLGVYESNYRFLKRLRLLEPWELEGETKELIKGQAFLIGKLRMK